MGGAGLWYVYFSPDTTSTDSLSGQPDCPPSFLQVIIVSHYSSVPSILNRMFSWDLPFANDCTVSVAANSSMAASSCNHTPLVVYVLQHAPPSSPSVMHWSRWSHLFSSWELFYSTWTSPCSNYSSSRMVVCERVIVPYSLCERFSVVY